MDHDINVQLTRFGYNFFPLTAMMLAGYTVKRLYSNTMSHLVKAFLIALTVAVIASGVRVGWFAVSRTFPSPGEEWNIVMWDLKIWMAMITGPVWMIAILALLHIMEKMPAREASINVAIITVLAWLWALI